MYRRVKEKRAFLLSELLIACVLISVLLGSLGYWTRRIWVSHKEKEQIYKIFLQEGKTYRRLRDIFSTAYSIEEKDNQLVFSFDRGVYIDPDLAGVVQGALHYNSDCQELSLIVTSKRKKNHQERILLWTHILAVEWSIRQNQGLGENADRVYLTLVRKTGTLPTRTLSYIFSICG